MRIGVILTGYNMEEYMAPCLWPWVNWQYNAASRGHEVLICAVNAPFEGFPVEPPDRTREMMEARIALGEIDHLITSDTPIKETEARGRALRWLVEHGANLIWQLDLDEFYTLDDITRILSFVEATPFVMSYRLSLRNAVFDEHTFLAEPFQPMRVHRTHGPGGHVVDGFYDDNNVRYTRPWERDKTDCAVVPDVQMASMVVPPSTALVTHLSWLSNARSRRKVEYQLSRGWLPSFRWDDEANQLRFNESYYARRGLPLPEVVHD